MKTSKEILQEHIGDNVIFDFAGNIIINGKLNANQITEAMEEYARQQVKNICDLANVVLQSEQLCQHDRSVTNRICDDCGSTITYVPDEDLA